MIYLLYAGLLVVGYLLGSVSPSILLARRFNIDIKHEGSGNAGATNVRRLMGTKWALLVLLIDFLKSFAPIIFLRLWRPLPGPFAAVVFPVSAVCILAALVLGHVLPLYFGFRGGKGVATLAGGWLAILPLESAVAVLVYVLVVAVFRRVSLGAVVLAFFLPAFYAVFSVIRTGTVSAVLLAGLLFSGIFILWTHRANIARLLRGTEPVLKSGGVK